MTKRRAEIPDFSSKKPLKKGEKPQVKNETKAAPPTPKQPNAQGPRGHSGHR